MAHRLAAILGTTVEDLLLPPGRDEVERQLPRNWLYEGVAPPGEVRRHFPAQLATGGGHDGYIVDPNVSVSVSILLCPCVGARSTSGKRCLLSINK